ncbi:MAG: mannose-1-phosphate guanylyltransferase [Pirellulaceae bacterium]|nr:mannose-1-phosphate guanylyltransferase [Pirellulaceae bacterium]
MLHAVIMAGGSGTRFWPASRRGRPKQLLNLAGENSMLQATVARLNGKVQPDNVLVVTNKRLVQPIQEQFPDLPAASILGEPCKRDTAPCIGLAAVCLLRNDPEVTMAVMPADHVITSKEEFQRGLTKAEELLKDDPTMLVTFGIRPTYPAESFGYIERGEELRGTEKGLAVYRVQKFREKPDKERAERYLKEGGFYWNSGIFVWKAATILAALKKHQPTMVVHLEKIADAIDSDNFQAVFQEEFAKIEGISIDYAVMENSDNIAVIEAPFDWDDVGNWNSLSRLHGETEEGNTILGKHLGIQTKGSIVRTEGEHLVVTVGVEDLIVVHTPEATLVAHKNEEESIRQIVQELEARQWVHYL